MLLDFKSDNSFLSCPICLEDIILTNTFSKLDACNHKMCQTCFKQLINYSNKCPLCGIKFTGCELIKENTVVEGHVLSDLDFENQKRNEILKHDGIILQ